MKRTKNDNDNMETMRFSIIENNLQRKHQAEQLIDICIDDDDGNDENRSISSESSNGDVMPTPSSHQYNRQTSKFTDPEVWQNFDIDQTLKQLPNAELIMELINDGDLSEIPAESEDVNTALLLAILIGRQDYVLELLTNYAADANACDYKGCSALHLACTMGNLSITKILLDHGADVNQWDTAKKLTPLHCAARVGSAECIQQLLKRGAQVNAGIEKRSAIHFAIEKNAINCVEILLKYGANPNTPQVYTETPLHTAAGLGLKECMELLLKHGADVRSQFGKRRLTALHLAAEDDYVDCVRLLLEHNAKVDARNVDSQTPLHLACLSQCTESVDLLLKHNADVNLIYKDGRTALHAAIVKESKSFECAKLILKAGVNVNKADIFGYTPLHIAALNEYSYCVYMLLEYGADMTCRTNGGISALSFIVRRTPEVIPKFISKFDASIKVNEHEIGDVDCEIKLDFRLLVPSAERGESELILAFIEVGQKRILKHPLCETFLFLKWRRIRKFFLFSLFYHAIYVLLFTLYILGVYDKDCKSESDVERLHCVVGGYVKPVGYAILGMNFTLLAKEFFQMAHGFISYMKYWENWIQLLIIIGVFMCATPKTMKTSNLEAVPVWQYHVAAIVIFFVWLELMLLVGRFPIFGLYVQMFTKVAMNFAKFLMAYSCLLIAFGLSFGVIFSNYPSFNYVPWTLLKTIIMMSGELEFEDIFYGDVPIQYPVTAHAMFLAFVILVTVILTNLLVGLAVSDIQGLQASAGLDRLLRQAELVARLEGIFFSRILRKAPLAIIHMCQRRALLRTSRYHLQFCIKPNDPRDKRLPKEIVFNIYKLVAERRDRNQSIKRRKQELNLSFFARSFDQSLKGVKIRNHSNHVPGPRTVSDNCQHLHPMASSSTLTNKYLEFDKNIQTLRVQLLDVGFKLNEFQEMFSKKMDDVSKELNIVKKKLDKR